MKTHKRTRKQHNCVECNVTYDKKTGAGWFRVECTSFENDVYIEMAGSDVSIWLCKVCTEPGQVSSGIECSNCFGRHGERFHNAL
jgi:hypothetical protein